MLKKSSNKWYFNLNDAKTDRHADLHAGPFFIKALERWSELPHFILILQVLPIFHRECPVPLHWKPFLQQVPGIWPSWNTHLHGSSVHRSLHFFLPVQWCVLPSFSVHSVFCAPWPAVPSVPASWALRLKQIPSEYRNHPCPWLRGKHRRPSALPIFPDNSHNCRYSLQRSDSPALICG